MSAYYHGIKTQQIDTSVSTPVTADCGITFAVGTAPVHTVCGKVNAPIMAQNYAEAVAALGYSDDWEKYTLCEVMHTHFKLYSVSPVFFVNVFDPAKHKSAVPSANYKVTDKKIMLPLEAIDTSITVKSSEVGSTEYEKEKDYGLFYEGENLIIEILESGNIPQSATELSVAYDKADPTKVTESEIIGGFDISTKQTTGLELIDKVFPKYGIVPDLIICPGWSHKPETAAIMNAKAEKINGMFEVKAIIDIDSKEVKHYADATEWKKKHNINSKNEILCYPMVQMGGKKYHMSTHIAGTIGKIDSDNGYCPYESPSNKKLQIDSAVLADGTEILLDLQQANYLNSNGIVTAINWIGGFVLWGNSTACFPSDTDVKNYFISVSRMFGWVSNSVILTYWTKLDKNLSRRLIDSIVDSLNMWLNGLVSDEKLLGARVEFKDEENSTTALMAGKAVFHVYMTPSSPAEEFDFRLEYDSDYIVSALKK